MLEAACCWVCRRKRAEDVTSRIPFVVCQRCQGPTYNIGFVGRERSERPTANRNSTLSLLFLLFPGCSLVLKKVQMTHPEFLLLPPEFHLAVLLPSQSPSVHRRRDSPVAPGIVPGCVQHECHGLQRARTLCFHNETRGLSASTLR